MFKLVNKQTNETRRFAFDLRYYESFQSDDEQNSGAYIFRPRNDTNDSIRYANLTVISHNNGSFGL